MLKTIYRKLVTLADPHKRRQADLLNGGPLEDRIEFDAFNDSSACEQAQVLAA